ncbi:pilus assembly protein TadG-related protein [Pseudolysinimonas sp.]|uniref:pilus assembly protein TadG-related protein n=1 Tax=Pseudolysinimonas sp. TaxID=2680009 RepID=UPI003F7E2CEA
MSGRTRRGDNGSTLPLILVFGMLALVLVLVVAAATDLYLARKRLFTLADGAALVGAESFRLDEVRSGPEGVRPALSSDEVRAAVTDYLADEPIDGFDGLRLEAATTPDGRSAAVTLSAEWRPPVPVPFVPGDVRIETTATARAVVSRPPGSGARSGGGSPGG